MDGFLLTNMKQNTKQKWDSQATAVKATQVAIDVSESVHQYVQLQSVKEGLKPSDFIRKILGLEFKAKKIRPRLTLSLSDEDYDKLAEKFSIDPKDRISIKHEVTKLLITSIDGNK
ncbi:MAG: hypothetical protein HWE27_01685 [Gammaproteobacteria bacterium]|nr:hypothetical protein [Gammaproteobacteria bacterium]